MHFCACLRTCTPTVRLCTPARGGIRVPTNATAVHFNRAFFYGQVEKKSAHAKEKNFLSSERGSTRKTELHAIFLPLLAPTLPCSQRVAETQIGYLKMLVFMLTDQETPSESAALEGWCACFVSHLGPAHALDTGGLRSRALHLMRWLRPQTGSSAEFQVFYHHLKQAWDLPHFHPFVSCEAATELLRRTHNDDDAETEAPTYFVFRLSTTCPGAFTLSYVGPDWRIVHMRYSVGADGRIREGSNGNSVAQRSFVSVAEMCENHQERATRFAPPPVAIANVQSLLYVYTANETIVRKF
jgi:hypothetical protein